MMELGGGGGAASLVVRRCCRHLGGLGSASIPPQACARRAGGRRLGAEPGRAACWRREGGGGACSRRSAAWTAPTQAPFLGPRPWPCLARAWSSFGAPWDAALRRKRTEQTVPLWWTEKEETGARLRWRLHSREKAECHHPVDLSTRNRQFGLETWVQGCSF